MALSRPGNGRSCARAGVRAGGPDRPHGELHRRGKIPSRRPGSGTSSSGSTPAAGVRRRSSSIDTRFIQIRRYPRGLAGRPWLGYGCSTGMGGGPQVGASRERLRRFATRTSTLHLDYATRQRRDRGRRRCSSFSACRPSWRSPAARALRAGTTAALILFPRFRDPRPCGSLHRHADIGNTMLASLYDLPGDAGRCRGPWSVAAGRHA